MQRRYVSTAERNFSTSLFWELTNFYNFSNASPNIVYIATLIPGSKWLVIFKYRISPTWIDWTNLKWLMICIQVLGFLPLPSFPLLHWNQTLIVLVKQKHGAISTAEQKGSFHSCTLIWMAWSYMIEDFLILAPTFCVKGRNSAPGCQWAQVTYSCDHRDKEKWFYSWDA